MYADLVKEQLPEVSENQILLEPARRNTAPCIAWASYHIRALNPNANIVVAPSDHLILKEDGVLAITVPPLKNEIVSGHLNLYNAGILLYQLVIAGFDCKDAIVKKYGYNISVIVKKNEIDIKNKLVYDNGDISTIKPYLPKQIKYDTNFKDISFCGDIESIGW